MVWKCPSQGTTPATGPGGVVAEDGALTDLDAPLERLLLIVAANLHRDLHRSVGQQGRLLSAVPPPKELPPEQVPVPTDAANRPVRIVAMKRRFMGSPLNGYSEDKTKPFVYLANLSGQPPTR